MDRPIAIFPLIAQNHSSYTGLWGRKKGLYILGYGSYSDYLNIIYNNDVNSDVFNCLIKHIKTDFKGMTLYVTDLREGSKFDLYLKSMEAHVIRKGVAVEVKRRATLEEYKDCLSKSIKQNLRTARNRMERDNISYKIQILGRINEKSLIDSLVALHIERVKEKNRNLSNQKQLLLSSARILIRQYKEKHNNIIAKSMSTMDNSCLVIVYLNENVAGYLYGLIDHSTIRILQNCVKKDYMRYSPMFRGAYDFIVSTYEKEIITNVDFTRGDEPYKYFLGGEEVKLNSYML